MPAVFPTVSQALKKNRETNVQPLLKVYGHIYPADSHLESALREALVSAIADEISRDLPLLERVGDMLRLSFEGLYFPEEEVVEAITCHLQPKQQGKLDVLDLDAWRMRRYFIEKGAITSRSASLNNVLDYSGF